MPDVKIFWDPSGFELDSLGSKSYLSASDGDTPKISVSIRMLSIDTPEVHYPGNSSPERQDGPLAQLADWIEQGKAPVDDELAQYLKPKLVSGQAGTLHGRHGVQATETFERLVEEKLRRPSGRKRALYIRSADEHFDSYGRLLAYVAPSYTREELLTMSRSERATFNLLMVDSGWAASFPIYPSLPKYVDLVLLQQAAKEAVEQRKGAWADPLMLTGYEFRMCVKLHKVTSRLVRGEKLSTSEREGWVSRYCVDMTTREVYLPQAYHKVQPHNRIFVWPKDVVDAVGKMSLVPAESA